MTSDAEIPRDKTMTEPKKWWIYAIFTASGFAALIYQSLWARYLKLFLGHAAYAQALVLIIFMFGIAAGSAIAARYSRRTSSPLAVYAAVEAVLALFAVYFHDIFVAAEAWALTDVLPNVDGDGAAQFFKWSLGASLILVQAILLGATFPLLAAGVVRRWPKYPGGVVSTLYFVNSAGAAAGVLFGGFFLVPNFGLVGAGLAGGAINAVIAAFVWWLSHRYGELPAADPPAADKTPFAVSPKNILIFTAAITGMSSFIYEIVWTRLISLLLGASVYSFEIMLASFIGGLAIGGVLVRHAADRIAEPMELLAKVQVMMGVFALASLPLYGQMFSVYAYFWEQFPHNEWAHVYHWIFGGVATAALILPTAICAGMTLPLITRRLMRTSGEASFGVVYAANTLGSIVGVYLAVHWLLSGVGAQYAMIIGALCDLLLGCALFIYLRNPKGTSVSAAITAAVTAVAVFWGGIPVRHAAAGVYRTGAGALATVSEERSEILFHRDGKTASITVFRNTIEGGSSLSIRTNGKSDASLYYVAGGGHSSDEMTMTSAGLLALLVRPDARLVANIGFGSGLTSRTILQSPALRRLDNIEIEPTMAEGARHLGDKIAPVFSDPRNNFIFDDAKTVFARAAARYDIIISEPSNPWISGIGGLFSREFYVQVKKSLDDNGVFVQWIPFYESAPEIFASVAGALGAEFGEYRMYLSGGGDAILIAAKEKLPTFKNDIFADSAAREFFADYGYRDSDSLEAGFIGAKEHLAPYFASFNAPINSDYFPFLEHEAPRAFFRRTFYGWANTPSLPVPFMELVGARPAPSPVIAPVPRSGLFVRAANATQLAAELDNPEGELRTKIAELHKIACLTENDRIADSYMLSVSDLISPLLPFVDAAQMAKVWAAIAVEPCIAAMLREEEDSVAAHYVRFWRALSLRDAAEIVQEVDALADSVDLRTESGQILQLAAIAAHYRLGNYEKVLSLLAGRPPENPTILHAARFVAALAAEKL